MSLFVLLFCLYIYVKYVYCVGSWWSRLGTEYLLRLVQVCVVGVLVY